MVSHPSDPVADAALLRGAGRPAQAFELARRALAERSAAHESIRMLLVAEQALALEALERPREAMGLLKSQALILESQFERYAELQPQFVRYLVQCGLDRERRFGRDAACTVEIRSLENRARGAFWKQHAVALKSFEQVLDDIGLLSYRNQSEWRTASEMGLFAPRPKEWAVWNWDEARTLLEEYDRAKAALPGDSVEVGGFRAWPRRVREKDMLVDREVGEHLAATGPTGDEALDILLAKRINPESPEAAARQTIQQFCDGHDAGGGRRRAT